MKPTNPYLDGLRTVRRDEQLGLREATRPARPLIGFGGARSAAKKSKFNPRNWQLVTGCTGGE